MKAKDWNKVRKEFLKGRQNFQGYYECELCKKWVMYPDVHHKLGRGSHPELAGDHDNLEIICHDCHRLKHNQ